MLETYTQDMAKERLVVVERPYNMFNNVIKQ